MQVFELVFCYMGAQEILMKDEIYHNATCNQVPKLRKTSASFKKNIIVEMFRKVGSVPCQLR